MQFGGPFASLVLGEDIETTNRARLAQKRDSSIPAVFLEKPFGFFTKRSTTERVHCSPFLSCPSHCARIASNVMKCSAAQSRRLRPLAIRVLTQTARCAIPTGPAAKYPHQASDRSAAGRASRGTHDSRSNPRLAHDRGAATPTAYRSPEHRGPARDRYPMSSGADPLPLACSRA